MALLYIILNEDIRVSDCGITAALQVQLLKGTTLKVTPLPQLSIYSNTGNKIIQKIYRHTSNVVITGEGLYSSYSQNQAFNRLDNSFSVFRHISKYVTSHQLWLVCFISLSSPTTFNNLSWHKKTKLRGLSPRANYTDRAAAAGRRSQCQLTWHKTALNKSGITHQALILVTVYLCTELNFV